MPLILIVDDEETILELISFTLLKEGFQVEMAMDGNEALQKAENLRPDLVVLDWMLPGMDGLEVCRKIRRNETIADLPVIMLTARGEEVDKIIGLELGADDYVTKPFSPRELVARIRAQLRSHQAKDHVPKESGKVIKQGIFYLDAERYIVKKNNTPLELSPREFELLFLLTANPGRVYRRDEILNKVWGYDYPADTRTVDVHVRYLRQKIEDDANNPEYLLTVRGVGYKFKEQAI